MTRKKDWKQDAPTFFTSHTGTGSVVPFSSKALSTKVCFSSLQLLHSYFPGPPQTVTSPVDGIGYIRFSTTTLSQQRGWHNLSLTFTMVWNQTTIRGNHGDGWKHTQKVFFRSHTPQILKTKSHHFNGDEWQLPHWIMLGVSCESSVSTCLIMPWLCCCRRSFSREESNQWGVEKPSEYHSTNF